MKRLLFALLPLLVVGCVHVSTTTKINADGSFTRTVKYGMMDTSKMGMPGGAGSGPSKPEDAFAIPSEGNGTTVQRGTEEGENVITVTRSVRAGGTSTQDITALGKDKKPVLRSTVYVKKLADGKIEYDETLTWVGPPSSDLSKIDPDLRANLKKSLPPDQQKTETIDKLTRSTERAIFNAMFGPPEPLMGEMMTSVLGNPEGVRHKLDIRMYAALDQALQEQGLSPEQRRSTLAAMVKSLSPDQLVGPKMSSMNSMMSPDAENTKAEGGNAAEKTKHSDDAGMVPLSFAVTCPGQVVETNGLQDPITGEVYWSLYGAAAELGDVTLRVVIDPSK